VVPSPASWRGVACAVLLCALAGCPPGPPTSPLHGALRAGGRPDWFPQQRCQTTQPADRSACYKPWTVLINMAADNDLIPYAYLNLLEMEAQDDAGTQAASTERTDVVVQLDTPGPGGLRRLLMLSQGERYDDTLTLSQLARRRESDLRSPVIEQLAEGADAAAQLRDFLAWGARRYPAEHYLVVVWGHGEGWAAAQPPAAGQAPAARPPLPAVPTALDDPFGGRFRGGLAFDWTQRSYLDIPALAEALLALEHTVGRPVDVYAADACLMQMAEVATELRDSARFVISSAYLQDFVGLPYRALLARLNKSSSPGDDSDPARQLALSIPTLYAESLDPARNPLRGRIAAELRKRFTMSVVATDELRRDLLPALGELGTALDAYQAEDPLRTGDLRYLFEHQTGLYGSIQDLGAFLGALKAQLAERSSQGVATGPVSEKLQAAIVRARAALDGAVPAYRFGTDYQADGQSALGLRALTVWLPVSESDFRTRIADYRTSALYRYGGDGGPGPWQRFIERLYPQ
jgi:hypothetical protein